jgi:hypothetical protein
MAGGSLLATVSGISELPDSVELFLQETNNTIRTRGSQYFFMVELVSAKINAKILIYRQFGWN